MVENNEHGSMNVNETNCTLTLKREIQTNVNIENIFALIVDVEVLKEGILHVMKV